MGPQLTPELRNQAIAACNRMSLDHELPLDLVRGFYKIGCFIMMTVMEPRSARGKRTSGITALVLGGGNILEATGYTEAKSTAFLADLADVCIGQVNLIFDEARKQTKAQHDQS